MSKNINDTQAMNIRLPVDVHKQLKSFAYFSGLSMNKIIVDAVRAELERTGVASTFTAVEKLND